MNKKLKWIVSVVLILSMVIPVIPASAEKEPLVRIVSGRDVVVTNAQPTIVSARTELSETLQWQIYSPEYDVWADIHSGDSGDLTVTYSMVISSADESGYAKLRCRAGEEYSDVISVAVQQVDCLVCADVPMALSLERSQEPEPDQQNSEEGGANGTVVVTVQYLFYSNHQVAADSTTFQLEENKAHSINVPQLPNVLGYDPFYQGVRYHAGDSLTIQTEVLTGDVTYTVYYQAADVRYKVVHHLQNVDNDNYVAMPEEIYYGPTDSYVGVVDKNYPGFSALLYEHPVIAADGSTVVDVFYDRNYYLMHFVLGEGGYGVYPVYARYEAAVDIGTPVRAGYRFLGWEPQLPVKIPAENTYYTAKWEQLENAQVSIVFWGENGRDDNYSYLGSYDYTADTGDVLTVTGKGLTICGEEEHHHSESCNHSCGKQYHVHSADCCTKPAHTHSYKCCTISTYTHTEEKGCFGNCIHKAHDYTCYGATALENPSSTDAGRFEDLSGGIQNGYIYRIDQNSYSSSATYDKCYLRMNDKWYAVPTDMVSAEDIVDENSHGFIPRSYTYKYNAVLLCHHEHTDECISCETPMHDHSSGCVYCTEGKQEHQHDGDSCTYCSKEEHIHTDCALDCYLEGHVHQDSCFQDILSGRFDSKLYRLASSKTVTVESDGSTVLDVYLDRTTFTMTFRKTGSNGAVLATITDKWGANIRDRFQEVSNANTFLWSRTSDGDSPWTSFVNVMPQENRTYYAKVSTSGSYHSAKYWGEIAGQPGQYELLYTTNLRYNGSITVSEEEFEAIDGYVFNASKSTKKGATYNGANFYYDRQYYRIDFSDGFNVVESAHPDYGDSLASYADFVPQVPVAYDAGGYFFDGWYLNPQCSGEPFDLTRSTMPSRDLILYAKWSPKVHTVRFFRENTLTDLLGTYRVVHNNHLTEYPKDVVNGTYEFLYWFYRDDSGEHAFDPENMPVYRDMDVYAKWNSTAMRPYIIHYTAKTGEKIAESTVWVADLSESSGQIGQAKTFYAKGPEELYDGYQHDYFPETRSHSVTLSLTGENEYTFVYDKKDAVAYEVHYLERVDENTLQPIRDPKVVNDNRHAVVTEISPAIAGYKADAYQKKLIIQADGENNVIQFIYTKIQGEIRTEYFAVAHYIQSLNGSWMEYKYVQDEGNIGEVYTAIPLTISGFTYDPSISESSKELTLGGMQLNLYYKRNDYGYIVRWLDENGNSLKDPVIYTAPYEHLVTVLADNYITANGRTYENAGLAQKTIAIRVEEDNNHPQFNYINFTYREKTSTITYKVIGPAGCGMVNPESQQLSIYSTAAQMAVATPNHGFRFVGWYTDEACENPATDAIVQDNTITPQPVGIGYETDRTYYAKFEYAETSLTIHNANISALDNAQAALIWVYSESSGVDLTLAIIGNGSATVTHLPIDTYTVTLLGDWTWRYEQPEPFVITLYPDGGNELTVGANRDQIYWLDGNDDEKSIFR